MTGGDQSAETGGAGDTPRVPAGTCVYAVGDIHGMADRLAALHRLILSDAERRAAARRVLVYVGDYVDRGPQVYETVEMLARSPLPGFEIHHLCGNHEDFLLRFHDHGAEGALWLMNGAEATLASYGVDVRRYLASGDLAGLQDAFRAAMPADHLAFYRGLEMHHREGDYVFVHAGVRPGVPLEAQRAENLLWIREGFLDSDADLGATVVHGHTITAEPEVRPNRIGIDTGAFLGGALTCLVLEGAERAWLRA